MTQQHHTPAPWHSCADNRPAQLTQGNHGHTINISAANPDKPHLLNRDVTQPHIADVITHSETGDATAWANARLIAASPELLEACEQAAGELRSCKQAAAFSDGTPEIDRRTLDTLLRVLDDVNNKAKGQ